MIILAAGLLVFLGIHILAAIRGREPGNIQDRVGKGAYMAVFSVFAVIGLALIVYGYGQARSDPSNIVLWTAPEWTRHLILALMPIAMILLVSTYAPLGYIKKAVRHPMITAIKLWAVLHLIINGDMASVMLFGGFLAFAVISRIMAKKRGAGSETPKPSVMGDVVSVCVGAALYLAFVFGLHQMAFGVPVLPVA